jgi:hypothetical protein
MRYLISALLVLMLLKVSGCLEEKFVPDPNDPRLPKYTESGNEIAGALISNMSWKTDFQLYIDMPSNYAFYISNYPNADSLIIQLLGTINDGKNKGAPIDFSVGIKGTGVKAYHDLKNLKNRVFTIDGKTNYSTLDDGAMILDGKTESFKNGSGTFSFVNVQSPKNDARYIISGTFDFRFDTTSGWIDVQKGRFDFIVSRNQYSSN